MPFRLTDIHPLHVFTLWGFAVVQPVFDLIGQYPTFLTAHAVQDYPLPVASLVFAVLAPALIVGVLLVLRVVSRPIASLLAGVLAGGLLLLALLPVPWALDQSLKPVPGLAAVALLWLVLIGAYGRFQGVRELLSLGAFGALMFPLIFLFQDSVRVLWMPFANGDAVQAVAVDRYATPPDVVFLVFDEFPASALPNGNSEVDASLFPNFAALAQVSDMYVRSSAVATRTNSAIPALLTAQRPKSASAPPTSEAFPANLFNLLDKNYALNVVESITTLCEGPQCELRDTHWPQVWRDIQLIYAHRVTPAPMRDRLPVIGDRWTGFGDEAIVEADGPTSPLSALRSTQIDDFISSIIPTDEPALHFLHTLLPHAPYQFVPSGRELFRHRALSGILKKDGFDVWLDDPRALVEARELLLWQLQYVDTKLGEILTRLRQQARFTDSIVVVTADHGVSLRPGLPRRQLTEQNMADIALVPLLIKRVGQAQGRVVEEPVQAIDVLPLLFAEMGYLQPDSFDGTPVAKLRLGRAHEILGVRGRVTVPVDLAPPPGERWWGADLADPIESAPVAALAQCDSSVNVELARTDLYDNLHPHGPLPAHALLESSSGSVDRLYVELNGVLHIAVPSGVQDWSAFLEPELFVDGHNHIRVLHRTAREWCLVYDNSETSQPIETAVDGQTLKLQS